MRVFTPESPYYTPLPRNSMDSLFNQLFSPFARGMSSTLIVRKGCGGGRALTEFLLLHIDDYAARLKIPVSSDTHSYISVAAPRGTEDPQKDFLVRLGNKCRSAFGTKLPPYSLETIGELLAGKVREKEFVFVIRGVNEMADYGVSFWDTLGTLQLHTGRVHFLCVFYDGTGVSLNSQRYGGFREFLNQNTVSLGRLDRKETHYSIRRWGYTLDRSYSKEEIREIAKVSAGCPSLIKACCLAVPQLEKGQQLGHHPMVRTARKRMGKKHVGRGEFPRRWREVLSETEYRVMEALFDNMGNVDRITIANALWGPDAEKHYSDEAITQAIRRIRTKLGSLPEENAKIRTVYGQGYRLEM